MIYHEHVKCEIDGAIATVTIDHAPVNALNIHVMNGLFDCFTAISEDVNLRAVIITGAGKSFIAGGDITEFLALDTEGVVKSTERGYQIYNLIESLPIPTIAAINGFALGGGLEIVLVSDICIASEKAKLGLPEVALGITPGYGGTARLARRIGIGHAKKMIFTGEHISAEKAKEIGLVQEVVPAGYLMARAKEIAAKIASNGPIPVRISKKALNQSIYVSLEAALETEAEAVNTCFASQDMRDGVAAFLDKKKPVFNNK